MSDNFGNSIWKFFEEPESFLSKSFRWFIVLLILISVALAFIELLNINLNISYEKILKLEYFIIGIFTLELLTKFVFSPNKTEFIKDKFNWIDFLAVFPFYLGINNLVILRILRLIRLLRLIKIFKQLKLFDFLKFKNSIFQKITPIALIFLFFKVIIYFLEENGYWFNAGNFDILFTIIGFALGVVLSNKIRNAYSKYLTLENSIFIFHGKLNSLSANLNIMANEKKLGNLGIKIVYNYLSEFLKLFKGDKEGAVRKLRMINRNLSSEAAKIGNTNAIPFHRMAAMIQGIYTESTFILSKRVAFTPKEYDRFVLHLVMFYLIMICFLIPGFKGIISIIFASYLLYGLYYLTNEFDYISGSDFKSGIANLISLDTTRLEHYLKDLKKEIDKK